MIGTKMKKVIRYPGLALDYFIGKGPLNFLSDEKYLRIRYRLIMRRRLNLEEPQTFSEKLQWLKLHDHCREYTMMVDKYAVRQYIAELIGEKYLIPLLGAWDDPNDINFDALPERFVLKCTHNSGLGMYICRDRSSLDVSKVRRTLRQGLHQNYYLTGREWPYKDVPRKIIAEKYMVDESGTELKDYKINCFNGVPKYIQVMSGRSTGNYYLNHFDLNWKPLRIPRKDHVESTQNIERPKHLDEMIEVAKKLSQGTQFVRIDLYHTPGQVYFGEITFFPLSGFLDYTDKTTDLEFGKLISLPLYERTK